MKHDCELHGWHTRGPGAASCPQCRDGGAPRVCGKHGWAHMSKGCPACERGDGPDIRSVLVNDMWRQAKEAKP